MKLVKESLEDQLFELKSEDWVFHGQRTGERWEVDFERGGHIEGRFSTNLPLANLIAKPRKLTTSL